MKRARIEHRHGQLGEFQRGTPCGRPLVPKSGPNGMAISDRDGAGTNQREAKGSFKAGVSRVSIHATLLLVRSTAPSRNP
jgi:hypothetical protein